MSSASFAFHMPYTSDYKGGWQWGLRSRSCEGIWRLDPPWASIPLLLHQDVRAGPCDVAQTPGDGHPYTQCSGKAGRVEGPESYRCLTCPFSQGFSSTVQQPNAGNAISCHFLQQQITTQLGPRGGVEADTAQRLCAAHRCSNRDKTWALSFPTYIFKGTIWS